MLAMQQGGGAALEHEGGSHWRHEAHRQNAQPGDANPRQRGEQDATQQATPERSARWLRCTRPGYTFHHTTIGRRAGTKLTDGKLIRLTCIGDCRWRIPLQASMTDSGDFLIRFSLEHAELRGVVVRIEETWQQVLKRAEYPAPIADLLGKSLVASALFTSNIKFEGALSIQLKSAGTLSLLFAECSHDRRLRGLARWRREPAPDFRLTGEPDGNPLLAITIENAASGQRYQGLVPVESDDLALLFERYFARSEQLPTRLVLASDGRRCAGLMLQQLPTQDANEDADGWNRAGHLLATLTSAELLELAPEQLLLRLFHDEGVRVHSTQPLTFGCRCTRERVAGMLHSLGREEAYAAVRADGRVEIVCEFCNTRYHFDEIDLAQVFRDPTGSAPSVSTH
jgi:molecular chaperone Hsp33